MTETKLINRAIPNMALFGLLCLATYLFASVDENVSLIFYGITAIFGISIIFRLGTDRINQF